MDTSADPFKRLAHRRRWTAIGTFALTCAVSATAVAETDDAEANRLRTACNSEISVVREDIANTQLRQTVLVVLGAAVAAAGSVTAGLTSGERTRKIGAAIGALSGVLTAGLQTLPNEKDAQDRLLAMDRQRVLGEKVFAQLDLVNDPDSRKTYLKFARARFTECRAEEPLAPPNLPQPRDRVERSANGNPETPPDGGEFLAKGLVESMANLQAAKPSVDGSKAYWVQLATGDAVEPMKAKAQAMRHEPPVRVFASTCQERPCFKLVLGPFASKAQAEEHRVPGALVTQGQSLREEVRF